MKVFGVTIPATPAIDEWAPHRTENPGRFDDMADVLMAMRGNGRPVLLDLFCCSGGAGVGYWRAGFEVVGVDITPRPDYPMPFLRADALDACHQLGQYVDLVHSSPPCQRHCTLSQGTNRARRETYPDLIPPMRSILTWYGVPSVIENVPGADIRKDLSLCGEQFGLGVLRHRDFELDQWSAPKLPHVKHRGPVRGWRHKVWRDGPYIAAYGKGGGKGNVSEMQQAMDITWTAEHAALTEAIPPAYTQWIGERFIGGDWGRVHEPDPAARVARLRRREPFPGWMGVAS